MTSALEMELLCTMGIFFYLFMAALSLRYCAQAFSSCSKQGPTVYYGVVTSQVLGQTGSVVAAH